MVLRPSGAMIGVVDINIGSWNSGEDDTEYWEEPGVNRKP